MQVGTILVLPEHITPWEIFESKIIFPHKFLTFELCRASLRGKLFDGYS